MLVAYLVSQFIKVPVSVIAGVVATLFILAARKSPAIQTWRLVKGLHGQLLSSPLVCMSLCTVFVMWG